jgi:hypothetical protein
MYFPLIHMKDGYIFKKSYEQTDQLLIMYHI